MFPHDTPRRTLLSLDLDPEVARLRSEHADQRLHTVEFPQQRARVLTAVTVLVWLHSALVPGSGSAADALLFTGVAAAYTCLSWVVLRLLYRPGRHSGLGLIFLACDVLVLALAIGCTGIDRSWLFLLPVVRVADQALTSLRRAVAFAIYAVACYGVLVWAAVQMGHAVALGPEAVKLAALLVIGLHIAATSMAAERERTRMASTIEEARDRIQELQTRSAGMERAQAASQAASNARGEFLASISHELRTPMNGVIGNLELALAADMGPELSELVTTAHGSSMALLRVVEDILDYSAVGSGRISMASEPFRPRDAVAAAVDAVSPGAKAKLLRLHWQVGDAVPDTLVGDCPRLVKVLTKLMDNAVKFTEAGSVELDVDLLRMTEQGALLRVDVVDTGIGIAQDHQRQIFEPFTQVDGTAKRLHGGTGMGLALTRRLVEHMGGQLDLQSTPGVGSRFRFTVCCPVATETAAAPDPGTAAASVAARATGAPPAGGATDASSEPAAMSRRTERPLRLLLVEDNKVNQLVARRILTTWGHAVDVADNGRVAIEALAVDRYDAVLMDIAMPVMDGFEATRKLRLDEQRNGGHLPIIAMTAHASPGDRERCLDAGMDDYVSKPVKPELLFDALERARLEHALDRL